MSNYEILNLYPHNIRSYEKIKNAFKTDDIAAIVHCTGSGKSYNGLQLALDNPDKKVLYIVPYNSIIEHLQEIINSNKKLDKTKDLKNIKFITYQSLTNMTEEELQNMKIDILILDEFHHIGAPIWGKCIKEIVDSHKNIKILGMSAYTVRNRGSIYERDMISPETDELFSNKVVSRYDLCDAIIDGVLPKPIYKSAYMFLDKTLSLLENDLKRKNKNGEKDELCRLIDVLKEKIYKAPSMKDVFKQNIKKDGKYIYFCPLSSDIDDIMNETKKWIEEMGLKEEDYYLYKTTSEMGEIGKKNRNAFYYDKNLYDENINNKLRIMFAINQYNEGSHVPGIDGVIMGRQTSSDIIYFEHLGRALSTKEFIKERYIELNKKTKEELIDLCKEKYIDTSDKSKSQLIDLLVCPVIIDLVNNIDFIKELENNLQNKIKEKANTNNSNSNNNFVNFINPYFDIDMLNQNIYEVLKSIKNRLSFGWDNYYLLLEKYYEHNENTYVPIDFKTINGYEYDENGYELGNWLVNQKRDYNNLKIQSSKKEMLELLNIDWNISNNHYFNVLFKRKKSYCLMNNLDINNLSDEEFLYKHCNTSLTNSIMSLTAKSLNDCIELSNNDFEEEWFIEYDKQLLKEEINKFLDELDDRKKDVIEHRYELNGKEKMTLNELSKKYGTASETIRQIEMKFLRKLRRTNRAKRLKPFLNQASSNYDIKSKENLKNSTNHKFDALIDFFFASPIEQQKQLQSLCYFHLKIKIEDFLNIIDIYSKNISINEKYYDLNYFKYEKSEYEYIYDKVEHFKSNYQNKEEYLEEFKKGGIKLYSLK